MDEAQARAGLLAAAADFGEHLSKARETTVDAGRQLAFTAGLWQGLRGYLASTGLRCAMLQARIEALEAAQREARTGMQYCGVWTDGVEHAPGDVTTSSGTLWYAHVATKAKPGTSPDWQLMVKSVGRRG